MKKGCGASGIPRDGTIELSGRAISSSVPEGRASSLAITAIVS